MYYLRFIGPLLCETAVIAGRVVSCYGFADGTPHVCRDVIVELTRKKALFASHRAACLGARAMQSSKSEWYVGKLERPWRKSDGYVFTQWDFM